MIHDPNVWGPGVWFSIHTTAVWADTRVKSKIFYDWIRNIQATLPCMQCKEHMKKYLEDNPPEKAPDLFVWSWEFHNAVTRRKNKEENTKKPEMDYQTAKKLYINGEISNCTDDCKKPKKNIRFNKVKK